MESQSWFKSFTTVFCSAILHTSLMLLIIGLPASNIFSPKEPDHEKFKEFRRQEANMPASCPSQLPLTDSLPVETVAPPAPKPAPVAKAKVRKQLPPKIILIPEAPETAVTTPAEKEKPAHKVVDVNFDKSDSASDAKPKAPTVTKEQSAETAPEPAVTPEQVKAEEAKSEPTVAKDTASKPVETKSAAEQKPVPVQDKIAGVQSSDQNDSSTEAVSDDLNATPQDGIPGVSTESDGN